MEGARSLFWNLLEKANEQIFVDSKIQKYKHEYNSNPSSINIEMKQLIAKTFSNCSRRTWLKFYAPQRKEPFNLQTRTDNLIDVAEVLNSVGLKFWLTNGTALCAFRDQDWIPWDDDIDLDTMMEDFLPKYDLIKKLLIKKGFLVRSTSIRNPRLAKISVFRGDSPFRGEKVAVRPLFLNPSYKNNLYRLRKDYKYPRIFYESKNPVQLEFKGKTFNIPSPPEKFLTYVYGKNWKTPMNSDIESDYSTSWIKRKNKSNPPEDFLYEH